VIASILGVTILAGGLALAFRDWRVRYQARANFGASQVATVIDSLADVIPPDVSRDDWRRTIAEAHAMLVALTGSNMMDVSDMRVLRAELLAHVVRARPQTVRAQLGAMWDELARRAGPNLAKHHPRPTLLSATRVSP
jgi:hypothetical protein